MKKIYDSVIKVLVYYVICKLNTTNAVLLISWLLIYQPSGV